MYDESWKDDFPELDLTKLKNPLWFKIYTHTLSLYYSLQDKIDTMKLWRSNYKKYHNLIKK